MPHTHTHARTSAAGLIALEVLCLSPSKLTSSKQGTKRQSQSMKFINENWNAFYSFLITRIVAHNWAGCIRLEITLHLRMCGSVCACVCVCAYALLYCMCVCVCSSKRHQRKTCIQKERCEAECGGKSDIKRGQRERVQWETDREKYEAMGYNKSKFLWYNTAPFCSCTEQHLLSFSCGNVWEE